MKKFGLHALRNKITPPKNYSKAFTLNVKLTIHRKYNP